MCLVDFDTPILVLIAFADDESVCTFSAVFVPSLVSCKKLIVPSASEVPLPIAYSSASAELVAIVACVFE